MAVTPKIGLTLPTIGSTGWGGPLNANASLEDSLLGVHFDLALFGGVADNSTDNATAFAALATAVNAYSGPGIPVVNIGCGPTDVAYKTSVGLAVTRPVYIRGNGTINYTGTGDAITLGPTGLGSFLVLHEQPYTVDGLTFVGGATAVSAIHAPPYVSSVRIHNCTFTNYGSSTTWPLLFDSPNNEISICHNWCWINDSTSGRNFLKNVDPTNAGSNTAQIIDNHILCGAPPDFTTPTGGTAIWYGGSGGSIARNNIYGFAVPIRLSKWATRVKIDANTIDTVGFTNAGVGAAIHLGDPGDSGPVGWAVITHNDVNSRSGQTIIAVAGDTTSSGLNNSYVAGNVSYEALAGAGVFPSNVHNFVIDNWTGTGGDIGTGGSNLRIGCFVAGASGTLGEPAFQMFSNESSFGPGQIYADFGSATGAAFFVREGQGGTVVTRLEIDLEGNFTFSPGSAGSGHLLFGADSVSNVGAPGANRPLNLYAGGLGLFASTLGCGDALTIAGHGTLPAAANTALVIGGGVYPVTTYQIASDSFSRANGGLGSNWTTDAGAFQITSDYAVANSVATTMDVAYYNAVSFPDDQWSQITWYTSGGLNDFMGVCVRASTTGTQNAYLLFAKSNGSSNLFLQKVINGLKSDLNGGVAIGTVANGDTIALRVEGTTLIAYHNGSPIFTTTDGNLASGSAGICGYGTTGYSKANNWSGGGFYGPLGTIYLGDGSGNYGLNFSKRTGSVDTPIIVLSDTGVISTYKGVATAGNGVPAEVFQVLSTGLAANYNGGSAKTLFTPTAAGMWRISFFQAITTAAGSSSTFPSLTLSYVDAGGVARTLVLVATSGTNTTAVVAQGDVVIMTDGSTPVTVTSASYASSGSPAMAYALAVSAEQM